MINGLQLFQECLQHPEELVDEFYCTDELIISADANKDPTPIMQTWLEVQKRITAADVALKDSDQKTYHRCVEKLDEVLRNNEYTNFLEFTSFFPAMDVSFSIYKKLRCAKRIEFLNKILRTYIEKRHPIYNSHGYSPNIIQVRKDFEKHKSSGSFFKNKILTDCNVFYKPCNGGKAMTEKKIRQRRPFRKTFLRYFG